MSLTPSIMRIRSLAVLIGWLLSTGAGMACTIPVFRFALDRWEADKFHLELPASFASKPEITDLLRPFRANGRANLDIRTDPQAKRARLLFSRENEDEVWSGDLDAAAFQSILDSPARQRIIKHILAGDSVLWVIVSDDNPEDKTCIEHIEKRLRFLEQAAALPIQDPNDPDSRLGPGPELALRFPTLRIDRNDPAETLLVRMLAGPTGASISGQSFAVAIFGRGRVLGSWKLRELDDASLEDACMFLIGRCSCRVKNENPGWDLLLNVDWDRVLQQAMNVSAAKDSSAIAAPAEPARPETVTIQPRSAAAAQSVKQPGPHLSKRTGIITVIAAVTVLAGLGGLIHRFIRSRAR